MSRRFLLSMVLFLALALAGSAGANPNSVTIAGDLQMLMGCPNNWDPTCPASHLVYDANDDVWQNTWNLIAGSWQYKAALDDSWNENYGLHAQPNGANIPLNLGADGPVKFYYDDKSHWVTDNVGSIIATAVGDFQSELGCSGDWDPGCLRSWLQDIDGDGIYTFETTALPPGNYQAKVAINEDWTENYGMGGVPNGPNIPFAVAEQGALTLFSYDSVMHILTINGGPTPIARMSWGEVKSIYR